MILHLLHLHSHFHNRQHLKNPAEFVFLHWCGLLVCSIDRQVTSLSRFALVKTSKATNWPVDAMKPPTWLIRCLRLWSCTTGVLQKSEMSAISSRTVRLPVVSCRLCRSHSALESRSGITGRRLNRRRERLAFLVCCASETESRKLISKSDIPLVYPRSEFVLQLFRWATIEAASDGLQNFGAAMNVTPAFKDPDAKEEDLELWGFDTYVLKDGQHWHHCTPCDRNCFIDKTGT